MRAICSVFISIFVVLTVHLAGAAELRVLHTTAVKPAMDELLAAFAKETGHRVSAEYGTAGAMTARMQKGEAVDVAVVTSPQIRDLQSQGKLSGGVDLAKVGLGAYIRKGGAKRDIKSVDAFKRTLHDVQSIAFIDPASGGASGIYIAKLLDRLGVADELKPKLKTSMVVAAVFDSVASGTAEIGLGQYSEIAADPRVEAVGMLPLDIQNFTLFAGGVSADSKEPEAAKALLAFIDSPAAQAVWKAKGFERP